MCGANLDMGGDHIGTGIGKGLDERVNRINHQMHIHQGGDMRPQRRTHRRAKGQIRHEMTIHHIKMHPIGTGAFDGAALCAETGKIGGEDRGGDLERAKVCHCCILLAGANGWGRWFLSSQQAVPRKGQSCQPSFLHNTDYRHHCRRSEPPPIRPSC